MKEKIRASYVELQKDFDGDQLVFLLETEDGRIFYEVYNVEFSHFSGLDDLEILGREDVEIIGEIENPHFSDGI
jgi:hypothetical protein